jgi:prepilin-type N-terminal cleavage/methylation domain-containing protein
MKEVYQIVKKIINIFNIKNQKGFSLIEMMVVVVILGLIVLGLVTFFTGGAKSWVAGQSQLKAQREARQAIDRMVREIREGENVKTSSDDDTIVVSIPALGSELAYDVTYDLSGNTIVRIKNTSSNPLIDNVIKISGESIFKYYDSSGIEINPPDSTVSKVHINLKVDVDKDNNPDVTLNTDVNLRNFGLQ